MSNPSIPEQTQQIRTELIQAFHDSKTRLVLALSGGGTLALSDLMTSPGASRTVLEAAVPYSQESLQDYVGRVPDQYCCRRTSRYLAMTAFNRGLWNLRLEKNPQSVSAIYDPRNRHSFDVFHDPAKEHLFSFVQSGTTEQLVDKTDLEDFFYLIGVGCTASLVTDREKKGEYRIHIATQTLFRTQIFSLQLIKGARSRLEEERLVADMILNAIHTARSSLFEKSPEKPKAEREMAEETNLQEISWNPFGAGSTDQLSLNEQIPLQLKPGEVIQGRQTVGSPPLIDLFFGKTWAVLWQGGEIRHFRLRKELPATQKLLFNPQAEFTQAIFSGSFNPIHFGHLEMIDIAERRLGSRVALEISVQNVDKPPLDYIELEDRLTQIMKIRPDMAVWLTQTPLFEEKSELFPGATFVMGADTLARFAQLRFYHESIHQLHDVLRVIGYHNCRFLVFARESDENMMSMNSLDVPDMLRSLVDEVPASEFIAKVSSRELRQNEF